MSAKTHLVVSSCDKHNIMCLNRVSNDPFFMPKNQIEKEEMKNRVLKLKHDVDNESSNVWQGEKDLAHKYLNKVLDIINEYRY